MAGNSKKKYEDTTPASPELLEAMLDDIGVGELFQKKAECLRKLVKTYCQEIIDGVDITMGDLQLMANCYYDGYMDGLGANGNTGDDELGG